MFFATTQFGQTVSSLSANFTITGTQKLNLNDDHYFWLSYDISSNAAARGNYLDAGCDSLKVEQDTYIPDTINPYGHRKIYYCIPSPSLFPCQNGYISQVRIASINNKSGCDSLSYSDFSNMSTTNYIGQNITYYVYASYNNLYFNIWVDFDDNGRFDSSEWVVVNKYSLKSNVSGAFTIPTSVSPGTYQVRVNADFRYMNVSWPCGASLYGETEDYKIKVIPRSPKACIAGDSVITTCVGTQQAFATNYDTGYYYYWYKNGSTLLSSGKGHPYDSLYYNSFYGGTDTITVKVIDSYNQIVVSNPIRINFMSKPIAGSLSISSDSICMGDSLSLMLATSTGNQIWQYYSNNVWRNMNSYTNNTYIFPLVSTSYRVVLTGTYCDNDTTNIVSVILKPKPFAGIASASNSNICPGKSVNIDLKGNVGYIDWQYYNDTLWSSIGNSNTINVSPTKKSNYRAVVSSNCGADTSSIISISIFPKPVSKITPSGPKTFCSGDSITLFADYAATYKWNTGDTTRTITIKQSVFTDVMITDVNGCEAKSVSNKYTFSSPPTPNLVQQNDTLFAFPLGAALYAWQSNGSTIAVTKENYILPQVKGVYNVMYIDSAGCFSNKFGSYYYTSLYGVAEFGQKIQVWPNPSDGIYNIIANVNTNSQVSLKVTDMTGRLLLQETHTATNGILNTAIDLSKFSNGIYLLYIDSGNGMSVPVKLVRE